MKIDTGEENKFGFTLRTNAVQALTKLIYAAKDNSKFLRIGYNNHGIHMSELACDGAAWVYTSVSGKLVRSLEGEYSCEGPGIVCVQAESLWRILLKQGSEDEFELRYNHKLKKRRFPFLDGSYQVLKVCVYRPYTNCTSEYELPILNGDRSMYSSETEDISFFSAIQADLLNTFVNVNTGESIDTQVEISVSDYMVQIEKAQGSDQGNIKSSRLTALTVLGQQQNIDIHRRHVFPGTVKKRFLLSHINEVSKFLNINPNGMIRMYMKNDPEEYPIIFEIKVGGIGQVVIAISPSQEN